MDKMDKNNNKINIENNSINNNMEKWKIILLFFDDFMFLYKVDLEKLNNNEENIKANDGINDKSKAAANAFISGTKTTSIEIEIIVGTKRKKSLFLFLKKYLILSTRWFIIFLIVCTKL